MDNPIAGHVGPGLGVSGVLGLVYIVAVRDDIHVSKEVTSWRPARDATYSMSPVAMDAKMMKSRIDPVAAGRESWMVRQCTSDTHFL